MKITFIGAAHEVTGSQHFVQVGDKRFLVDCGMEQGADIYENQEIPVDASQIDYVFVTHAHIDHSGLLPLLYAKGFRGQVYATEATSELCEIMLKDSAHIQQAEAEWQNRKASRAGKEHVEPLYTMNDALGVIEQFVPMPYGRILNICPEISIRFVDAGHLLGSSSIEVWLREGDTERKVVFSGDLGHKNRPLIKPLEFIEEADYVLVESTYGTRLHDAPPDFARALVDVLEETFNAGGNVVIPAFSVGRTQEILYFLRIIKEDNLLPSYPDFPVYMDSPLAVEATAIFHENVASCFSEEAKEIIASGRNPIRFDGLKMAVSSDESRLINMDMTPKVIISASGMCEAGRIRHHLKHNLWRRECSIVFVGFQVPGTLGSKLLGGAKEVKLFGENVYVRAKIRNLPGISGHADKEELLGWLGAFTNRPRVFVVHGDDKKTDEFADIVHSELGLLAQAPYSGDSFDLITGEQLAAGDRKPAKGKGKKLQTHSAYTRLLETSDRLRDVIAASSQMANKDLAKLNDQLNQIIEKWLK